jgi:hypothetical protein
MRNIAGQSESAMHNPQMSRWPAESSVSMACDFAAAMLDSRSLLPALLSDRLERPAIHGLRRLATPVLDAVITVLAWRRTLLVSLALGLSGGLLQSRDPRLDVFNFDRPRRMLQDTFGSVGVLWFIEMFALARAFPPNPQK